MSKFQKNKLAESSFFANLKNFILNFIIAIVWLVKSMGKYIARSVKNIFKK